MSLCSWVWSLKLPFLLSFSFSSFWKRIKKTESLNTKMKARRAMKKRKNWKIKKYHYSMRVSSTSEWRLRRIAMYLHKIGMNTRTGVLGSFSIKGVRSLYFSKWVRSNIVSHPEYHLTVVCSNRSDNLSLHVAHFRMPSWRKGHNHTAVSTSIALQQGRTTKVNYDFAHFSFDF